jgi:hypothetical protein
MAPRMTAFGGLHQLCELRSRHRHGFAAKLGWKGFFDSGMTSWPGQSTTALMWRAIKPDGKVIERSCRCPFTRTHQASPAVASGTNSMRGAAEKWQTGSSPGRRSKNPCPTSQLAIPPNIVHAHKHERLEPSLNHRWQRSDHINHDSQGKRHTSPTANPERLGSTTASLALILPRASKFV